MNIILKVYAILSDPNTESQIIILKSEKSMEILPVWIGIAEGNAIRLAMEGIIPPRPMTHDLLKNLLDQLGITLTKVIIRDIRNNTFYASIYLEKENSEIVIDARPSDAICLSMRFNSPIYAKEEVFKKSGSTENLDVWLDKLRPKKSGEYDA
ncbi:MAG: bifunctional nuclease family protein [Nitrospirota bacterium]